MGANRPPPPTAPWTVNAPAPTLAATARPTGTIDLYTLPSGKRPPHKPPRLPPTTGVPTSLSLRPTTSPPTHPLFIAGTHTGTLLLDDHRLSITPPLTGPILATHYTPTHIVAVGGGNSVTTDSSSAQASRNDVVVIDPATRSIINRFSLSAHHLSPITHCTSPPSTPSPQILFCSQAVTAIDVTTSNLIRRYTGHATPVSASSSLETHTLTACQDAIISIWHTPPPPTNPNDNTQTIDTPQKRRRTAKPPTAPVTSLLAPRPGIKSLSAIPNPTSRPKKHSVSATVAALLATDEVAVWRACTLPTSNSKASVAARKPQPPSFTVTSPTDAAIRASVFAATWMRAGVLAVVHGNALKPSVHVMRVADVADGEAAFLPAVGEGAGIMAGGGGGGGVDGKTVLVKASERVHVSNAAVLEGSVTGGVGGKELGGVPNGTGKLSQGEDTDGEMGEGEGEKERGKQGRRGSKGKGVKETDDDEDEDDDDDDEGEDGEPTLQDKLEALGIAVSEREQESASKQRGSKPSLVEATRTDSRVSVLLQAVRSRDSQLLDTCLLTAGKEETIHATVRGIPSAIAINDLFGLLVERLRVFPRRGDVYAEWIRAVLMEHSGAIVLARRNEAVGALVAVCGARTRSLDALTRLQGRLELVVAQSDRIRRMGGALHMEMEPLMAYEEEAEEEEESSSSSDSSSGEEEEGEDGESGEGSGSGDADEDSDESEESGDGDADMEGVKKGGVPNGVGGKKMNGKMDVDGGDSGSESSGEDSGEKSDGDY